MSAGRSIVAVALPCLLGAAWLAAALFWAAPAPFTIDGFTYWAMIDAIARDGSLFVENGYAEYRAEALRLVLMVPSGDRLAPQYPGGWGIFAAPAYMVAGLGGVVILNSAATAVTLWLVWSTARGLFDDRRVAASAALIYGLASFAAEYAFGVWPHAIATMTAALAIWAAVRAWRADGARVFLWAAVAGLAVGAGLNFRVDVILVLPPVAVWLLGTVARPYRTLGALLAGLVPGAAAAAAINHAKFGTFSPISYGQSEGSVSLGHYSGLMAIAAVLMVALLALGLPRVRRNVYRPVVLGAVMAAVVAAIAAIPQTRQIGLGIVEGIWVLVVNFQDHPGPYHWFETLDDGTVVTFGLRKKALLQSMPWAAVLVLLVPGLFRGERRAPLALGFMVVAAVVVPFAMSAWHGGMSSNMRYFLHAVPMIAILGAVALIELKDRAAAGSAAALAALVAVIAAGAAWPLLGQGRSMSSVVQIDFPGALMAGIALTALAAAVLSGTARAVAARMAASLTGVGLLTGFVITHAIDIQASQQARQLNIVGAEAAAGLPEDALLVTPVPSSLGLRVNRPPALTAQAGILEGGIDADLAGLVRAAHAEGRAVVAHGGLLAQALLDAGLAHDATPLVEVPRSMLFLMEPPRD